MVTRTQRNGTSEGNSCTVKGVNLMYTLENLQQAYQQALHPLIDELEKINFQHAIDLALDRGDKEMFLTLTGGEKNCQLKKN